MATDDKLNFRGDDPLICPFIGMSDDPFTHHEFPSKWNCCNHCDPAVTPLLDFQLYYCLSATYRQCPVYLSEAGKRFPREFREQKTEKLINVYKIILSGLGILGVAIILYFLGLWVLDDRSIQDHPAVGNPEIRFNEPMILSQTMTPMITPTSTLLFKDVAEDTKIISITSIVESIPTPVQSTATDVVHSILPNKPAWIYRRLWDTNSSPRADEKTASGGDDYYVNKYERPFSQLEMDYYPDGDIWKAEITSDINFYYVSIYLVGTNPITGDLTFTYGVELDINLDGRGDYLILCYQPNHPEWSIGTCRAYADRNGDIGGKRSTYPEVNFSGDGFEMEIFSEQLLDDPDGVWCRKSEGEGTAIEIAVHRTLVGSPSFFAWGVWADGGINKPEWFDYNDHFSLEEAGSPLTGNINYPLKEIHLVDNTCRESFGFTPIEEIPGMCFVASPTATRTPASPTDLPFNNQTNTPNPTLTYTDTP